MTPDQPKAVTRPAAAGSRAVPAGSRAVVLLSGGLDSATTAALAAERGFAVHAITFLYGQRHAVERHAADRVAASLRLAEHVIFPIDLRIFGGSALTADIDVPKAEPRLAEPRPSGSASNAECGMRNAESGTEPGSPRFIPHSEFRIPHSSGIPITYVPARNTIFLSIALAWAEVLGAGDIFIGVNAVDYSGYPDCRPEFVAAFGRLANLATRAGVECAGRQPSADLQGVLPDRVQQEEGTGRGDSDAFRIHAPLINLSKADIIREGMRLGVDFSLTHSCYDPDAAGRACGRCESCLLRLEGFRSAGLADPAAYRC